MTRRLRGTTLGARGELIAEDWLHAQGFSILERNFRVGDDEADLIALDPDRQTLVIVEVKTRAVAHGHAPASPEEAVGSRKQRHLARIAARIAQFKRYAGRPLRFDVIAVVCPEGGQPIIRHIPAAFESPY